MKSVVAATQRSPGRQGSVEASAKCDPDHVCRREELADERERQTRRASTYDLPGSSVNTMMRFRRRPCCTNHPRSVWLSSSSAEFSSLTTIRSASSQICAEVLRDQLRDANGFGPPCFLCRTVLREAGSRMGLLRENSSFGLFSAVRSLTLLTCRDAFVHLWFQRAHGE